MLQKAYNSSLVAHQNTCAVNQDFDFVSGLLGYSTVFNSFLPIKHQSSPVSMAC